MQLNIIPTSVTTLLLTAVLGCIAIVITPSTTHAFFASTPVDLNGYAWSSTIGWISLGNNGNEQVTINTDGTVTGHAWSPNIGWIKFGGLSSFPSGGGVAATNATMVDIGGGNYEMRGWARACAGTTSGDCSTMTSRTDGWDGWIALSGTNHSVQFNASGPITNSYAWGDAVVGWIDMFNHVSFTVFASADINATGCTVLAGASSCNGSVTWQFTNASNPIVERTSPSPDTIFSSVNGNAFGNQDPYTMQLGTNTFEARDDSGPLDTVTVSITNGAIQCTANASPSGGVCQCNSGYTNSGGVCQATTPVDAPTQPTVTDFTVTPPIVRKGQDVTVVWDTSASSCVITTTQGNSVSGGATGTTNINITANNQVIVTLTCDGFEVGKETVRILPSIFES